MPAAVAIPLIAFSSLASLLPSLASFFGLISAFSTTAIFSTAGTDRPRSRRIHRLILGGSMPVRFAISVWLNPLARAR